MPSAFFRSWLQAAVITSCVIGSALAGAPPFPLGTYIGNPDAFTPANEATFEARYTSFAATMGAAPQTMNTYTDFTAPADQWPTSALWSAVSWARSPLVGRAVTPVIGIPMSDSWHWQGGGPGYTNDDFFKAIVAGTYDADYKGIVDAWAVVGYKTFYLRFGYEMDGGFMPWFMGNDSATQADWVAAFQHLSILMRAEATAEGAVAYTVWNPADINWTQLSVQAAYPGNAYVDVVATDAYSPLYPTTLYDWALNNWSYDSTIQQWWAKPANMRHYWSYPSANPWAQTGSGGWGFEDTITFARAHHKPLAVAESGAGGDGTSNGPVDNPFFPDWLARQLHHAQTRGVTIAFVQVWDVSVSDGNWAFSEPGDGKPLEAAAWVRDFGAPPPPPPGSGPPLPPGGG